MPQPTKGSGDPDGPGVMASYEKEFVMQIPGHVGAAAVMCSEGVVLCDCF